MNAHFFGPSEAPLFGVYDAPTRDSGARVGTVLCYPTGFEYFKAHRAFRLLAGQIARRGGHAWRFDYRGTGDSAGDGMSPDVAEWLDDISAAIDELRSKALAGEVTLVGARFGALMAAEVASRTPHVTRLALWDPVLDGRDYVAELLELAEPGEVPMVVGCPLPSALQRQLSERSLEAALDGFGGDLALATSSTALLDATLDRLGADRVESYSAFPDERTWSAPDQEPVIPHPALRWIAEWVAA